MSDNQTELQTRFMALCGKTEIPSAVAESAWQKLADLYTEPHRHYHNFAHIDSMLRQFDHCGFSDNRLEMAIWFHDAIYDPKARDNEMQSANLFESSLGRHVGADMSETVVRLILATQHGGSKFTSFDESLISDIDLTILAASAQDYKDYAAAIRQEYSHVPAAKYRAGRISVLSQFLQEPIYNTTTFKILESAARCNIEAEIRSLSE